MNEMLLLCGPRQVGKTFIAKQWLRHTQHEALYFNWDDEKVRRDFRKNPHFFESEARQHGKGSHIVFDEIHKLPKWKTLLKGYYDTFSPDFHFLVTGSARLELFQKAGDSLLGRYHLLHLYPLNPQETSRKKVFLNEAWIQKNAYLEMFEKKPLEMEGIHALLQYSGFPAPFLRASERALNLWHREYRSRLLHEDLRDLTRIMDLNRMEHLFDLLPSKIGSPLSFNSLREDLLCSHDAVGSMLYALERLSILFFVRPYSRRIQNSIKKEPKVYFFDWTQVKEPGTRFENFMAVQLKSWCDFMNDGGWANMGLFYLRDKQKREVDFLILRGAKPFLLVEVKLSSNKDFPKSLDYFSTALGSPPSFCVTLSPGVFSKSAKDKWLISANRFFNLLWC